MRGSLVCFLFRMIGYSLTDNRWKGKGKLYLNIFFDVSKKEVEQESTINMQNKQSF